MQVAATLVLLITYELCLAIRVPVVWDASASEVKQEIKNDNNEQFSVESFKPQNINTEKVNVNTEKESLPVDYFQYTAKKPQFAVDIAKFHGVQSPENHYKAYSIKPYTGKTKPQLGKHHIFDNRNVLHKPLQEFAELNEDAVDHAVPVSSSYEVFHPYEAETPALQEIYKDPVLSKIRTDLENSKNRLQTYEENNGQPGIRKDLESPEKTDERFVPHRNVPAPYEIHRPQRRPIYYRPVVKSHNREQYLNQKFKHPWHQYPAKIRPINYRPVKNHIHQLRQNHALKYDDQRNEYPQVQILENYSSDPKDGYDIYEKGKEHFFHLRNKVDESINKAVKENRPATYQKLEMQNGELPKNYDDDDDDDDEFVPIKNYAQVRKTETYKHLPRSAALAEAESFDEIRNAPRLREAVKSTKAQTVYSEEGYEDSAYDHAGEQKHASENEGHGGYLKEHELSGGKYKTPSESAKYADGGGSEYRDQVIHGEKWKDDNTNHSEDTDEEDYSENEQETLFEANKNENSSSEDRNNRNKRENDVNNPIHSESPSLHNNTEAPNNVQNQSAKFEIPELDLKSTYLTEQEILKLGKIRVEPKKNYIKQKYPYYFKNLTAISKHSPLRYAENLKLIPKKSKGGTEFYDSRSKFTCPDVDDAPNPVPEKFTKGHHPDDNAEEDDDKSSTKGDENYNTAKKTPRLKGLGDKIDCFKAKYFGENPLDSPFFKEDIILSPEPLTVPNLATYKLKSSIGTEQLKEGSQHYSILNSSDKQQIDNNSDTFNLMDNLENEQIVLPEVQNINKSDNFALEHHSNVYNDILNNIKNSLTNDTNNTDAELNTTLTNNTQNDLRNNITYNSFQNIEDVTQSPFVVRKKRSTSFIYEPYKIIREGQIQDSKKTTTSSNISPLIRQLQSSRVVDKVPKHNQENKEQSDKHVKRNVNSRVYKEINKKDRELGGSKNDKMTVDPTFIDINYDNRRGEPRYEIRRSNHKSRYTPVENKKSMSIDEYKTQTKAEETTQNLLKGETSTRELSRQRLPILKLKSRKDTQNGAASTNAVQKILLSTTEKYIQQSTKQTRSKLMQAHKASEDNYDEYNNDEDYDDKKISTITTTTTQKPSFRKKTSEIVPENTERPKLKLVTRFRDYNPEENTKLDDTSKEIPKNKINKKENQDELSEKNIPKYREKKKQSTKSTLVTDTKRYGSENDDSNLQNKEVDEMIGVNQNMDDYLPLYELEHENVDRNTENRNTKNIRIMDESRNINNTNKDEHSDNIDDTEFNEDFEEVGDDDEDYEDEEDDHNNEDDTENDYSDEDISEEVPTTPEPTKRTLAITTDAPVSTTASRNIRPALKPIITRKKVEIHKELPYNRSAPHVTQFKQDIKEVEIIKELPVTHRKKSQKNLEALELYKDDNLAKDVNKLGGVEIFKENIDLQKGPRHGGNYRSLDESDIDEPVKNDRNENKFNKNDAEASQTEFTRHIELDDNEQSIKLHGGNFKALNNPQKSRSRGRNSKLIDMSDSPSVSMHGENWKHRRSGRIRGKSQKLTEIYDDQEDQTENDPSSDHESFSDSASSGPMHGGNYQSERITAQEEQKPKDQSLSSQSKETRRSSAAILNSYVQVAPILTTTPAYILDPSKRMYYYVDA